MNVHAEESWSLLETEILNDVGMVQILEGLALQLESFHHGDLSRIVHIAVRSWDLHLLDGDHLSSVGVESKVHLAISTFSNKLSTNPTEYGYQKENTNSADIFEFMKPSWDLRLAPPGEDSTAG